MKLKYNIQFFAAGKVTTGFSKPYVAKYNANGGVISFTGGRKLARGVQVSLEPTSSDDNKFYADNVEAESASGVFTGGTLNLTVDGLFMDAERFIQGLPAAGSDGWVAYGDNKETPNIAVGYLVRYMSGGVTTYVPTIIIKTKFGLFNQAAATQGEEIDWQTQELSATMMRADNANHDWKWVSETEFPTEEAAELALQTKMGIYVTDPIVEPMADGLTTHEKLVSDLQTGIEVVGNTISGTLKFIEGGLEETGSLAGDGNFLALHIFNVDSRATSLRVGLDNDLAEIISDTDKNVVVKVTATTQKFNVVSSDGTHTSTASYDLTGLTLLEE